jgi:YhcH/YjgK/YiaL family protein
MITGLIDDWNSCPIIKSSKIWEQIFNWLQSRWETLEIGDYKLPFGDCKVRVMQYDLKNRDLANFESHLHTIDLQLTIIGAEGIEWMPVSNLKKRGSYLEEKDFQFYETPDLSYGKINNIKGSFCILFPEDGHMPQLVVEQNIFVKKLVVKIPTKSL